MSFWRSAELSLSPNRPLYGWLQSHRTLDCSFAIFLSLSDFTLPCPTDRMLTFIRSAKTNISRMMGFFVGGVSSAAVVHVRAIEWAKSRPASQMWMWVYVCCIISNNLLWIVIICAWILFGLLWHGRSISCTRLPMKTNTGSRAGGYVCVCVLTLTRTYIWTYKVKMVCYRSYGHVVLCQGSTQFDNGLHVI